MANLEESAVWTPGVYQIETGDPVLGGPVQPAPATGGLANRVGMALANRTAYLKAALESTNQVVNDGLQSAADALAQTDSALQAQIAGKADLDSPVLTGSPRAPTPAPADDSTRLATTAYVTTAIAASGLAAYSIAALPGADIGPVLVIETCEFWVWVSTAHYTGYRSPLCGRPVDGHTAAPLAGEIDAVGGLVSKSAYAGLWGYAQENNLVVTQTQWSANIGAHWFVDVSASQFRVPDLRNQFRRFTGTDADSGTARVLGSWQKGSMAVIDTNIPGVCGLGHATASHAVARTDFGYDAGNTALYPNTRIHTVVATSLSPFSPSTDAAHGIVRVQNTAFHPRIHV